MRANSIHDADTMLMYLEKMRLDQVSMIGKIIPDEIETQIWDGANISDEW